MGDLWYSIITLEAYIISTQGCRLWMCDAPENHALLVDSKGYGGNILYPDIVDESWSSESGNVDRAASSRTMCKSRDHSKAIDIPEGESMIAACPGPRNKLRNFEKSSFTLTCYNDQLMNNKMIIQWSELGCLRKLRPYTRSRRGKRCGDQKEGHIRTIGWKVEKLFIPQIDICFNEDIETTLYTRHFIHGRYIDAKAVDPKQRRPSFKRGKLFSVKVNSLYKKKNQKIILGKLLGEPDHLAEFGKKQNYLARGHLAPDADFVTEAEQNATFSYGNVVPQWQGFNNGNWKKLEGATRDLALKWQQTLIIWTGSHGVLHLPDDQGTNVPVYLGLLEKRKIVPVPELMWKVIHSSLENQSVVFIGLNNIHEPDDEAFNTLHSINFDDDISTGHTNLWNSLSAAWDFGVTTLRDSGALNRIPLWITGNEVTENSSLELCQDMFSEVQWMKWHKLNIAKKGKIICCSLYDAKKLIPTLHEIDDTIF
ncbi:unnamed protein product [Meganyctiphanes norvegica]|uniref:DNA/RNA non-specific endonuclease/pyrophosphatase/phosphodiesterase domain-containing protein n=1 Tax=Meganyctiphanes norvegica TaxID=48144 RepID=A0AAV2RNC3_MEGNR